MTAAPSRIALVASPFEPDPVVSAIGRARRTGRAELGAVVVTGGETGPLTVSTATETRSGLSASEARRFLALVLR